MQRVDITHKRRPSLALVIGVVCALLVALPVIGVGAARLTSNQFVRETERSLLAQAAVYAQAYALAYQRATPTPRHGVYLSEDQKAVQAQEWTPVDPSLSLFRDIKGPRPDAQPALRPIVAPYSTLSAPLSGLAHGAQKTTLAGFMAIDAFGRVIGGSGTPGYNLGHVEEVARALNGHTVTVLRRKVEVTIHPLNSISRNTAYRVFVAHPVIVENRVIGAVYLSRTPVNLRKFLYQERFTLTFVGALMVGGSLLVGVLFWRLVAGPIRRLADQSRQVARGERTAPEPLDHYGLRETAELGGAILSMAGALSDRSHSIDTYTAHVTHELKSPVTAIKGAAELLESANTPDRQALLTQTIQTEAQRMTDLLGKLRELANAKTPHSAPSTHFPAISDLLRPAFPDLRVLGDTDMTIPLSPEQSEIVFTQLFRNAVEHGATQVKIEKSGKTFTITDNGHGISPANLSKIADPFFTTRRNSGGTGMGLSIVKAVLDTRGAQLNIPKTTKGAAFQMVFPT
jgi:signal transduction histidine kinase